MVFRKTGWLFGLTKERKTELSDVLYETGKVTEKQYIEEDDCLAIGVALENPALGIALSEDEEHYIRIDGSRTSFEFDDEELFRRFNRGDRVRISYRERHTVILDYVPPDFDQKQQLNREHSGYEFVNAERLD